MWQFQWILSLVPDNILIWIYYLFTGLGFALYVGSKLVKLIPFMGQYKLPAEVAGVIVLCGGFYLLGGYGVEMSWRDRAAEMQKKVEEAEAKSKETNIQIVTQYKDKVKIVKEVQVVVQERIKEVEKRIDAECKIGPDAISILNQSAKNVKEAK